MEKNSAFNTPLTRNEWMIIHQKFKKENPTEPVQSLEEFKKQLMCDVMKISDPNERIPHMINLLILAGRKLEK